MTTIEDLSPDQFALVASWLTRPDTNRWLTGEWRGRQVEPTTIAIAVRSKRNRLFLVRTDGNPSGLVALADIDLPDGTAMVWYALGDLQLAGRGVTSRAVRLVAEVAFNSLGLSSLHAWIMEDNVPSRRVLQKSGFRDAGRLREASRSGERLVDRLYFDLLPKDLAG